MNAKDCLQIARRLAAGEVGERRGRPRQADLCRAVSTAYYALFHTLARCGADLLVGATRASRSQAAWRQAYRALDHGLVKKQCGNRGVMTQFPPEIQNFGETFVVMQRQRHLADYAPDNHFKRLAVLELIYDTEQAIAAFEQPEVGDIHRRAFAVYVLFQLRRD